MKSIEEFQMQNGDPRSNIRKTVDRSLENYIWISMDFWTSYKCIVIISIFLKEQI